jgi:hypothetical protein
MAHGAAIASIFLPLALLAQQPDAQPGIGSRLSDEVTKAIDARFARIRAETAGLGDDPGWSGRYYRGDGLAENLVVELAPEAGYAIRLTGCLGTYDQDHGTCTERDGRITLASAFPDVPEPPRRLASEIVPVRWGERRYLIPGDGLLAFANAVNAGTEPRDGAHGSFLLRVGDERRRVEGRPELPEEATAMLLEEPVTGTVTAVHESRIEHRGGLGYRVSEATIDRGTEHGLKPGHCVHFRGRGFGGGEGRVIEIAEGSARVRIRDLVWEQLPGQPPEPAVGLEWSTRLPEWR